MTNYIERYWRDATPEDAIKDQPMVSRFKLSKDGVWFYGKLYGIDRTRGLLFVCGQCVTPFCQVYDAPDPGEGWRLIDTENEQPQDGDEIYYPREGTWQCRKTPFQTWAKSFNRRRITPTVTYVPFTWEDREQLRGRWVRCIDVADNEWMITSMYIGGGGELRANGTHADRLLSEFVFLDTGKPVGKEIAQ